jgi:predicted AlkP superfamily pyrophosphatase or phosphodiesterase
MKKIPYLSLSTSLVFLGIAAAQAVPRKPKLVVAIVVDQFRFDYLTRYRAEYKNGFDRLLRGGAVFESANYVHVPTITAVGHSTILTGAPPMITGIVANNWFDRETNKPVSSVSDDATKLVGGPGAGSSPQRLLVSTLGDELKIANGKSLVVGVSLKDRSAILPTGRMADAAYWFDVQTGNMVTSTYYASELPQWAATFNEPHPADQYRGKDWLGHKLAGEGKTYYTALESTPWGNEIVEGFAERALEAWKLGTHDTTDVFTVSFSCNDYVGHDYGNDSPEAHDTAVRTDVLIGKLLDAVDRQAGVGQSLVVLTADHGAAPLPEANLARRMPGGRLVAANLRATVQKALEKKHGPGDWVAGNWDLAIYLNQTLITAKKLNLATVEREAADAVGALPGVYRTYTLEAMRHGEVPPDEITRKVANGFHTLRGPDVEIIPEPYWVVRLQDKGTSHATPYSYDTHVPLILMGPGIRPGKYFQPVIVNDLAPTLAAILEVETPAGSIGRVLSEIFE